MQGKIALEEHFAIPETLADSRGYFPDRVWQEVKSRVLDLHERRLKLMDENGIEMMLLSLNAPAVQAMPDTAQAHEMARRANDYLAEQVAKRPDRFQGLAALAMQDPEIAARELERCVKELGFRGALVNGFSQVGNADTAVYYDLPQYRPFWAVAERLEAPFYLHPRNPLPRDAKIYEGHGWLMGPIWAFGQETAVHALRLMGSGLFDSIRACRSSSAIWARTCRLRCGAWTMPMPGSPSATPTRRRNRSGIISGKISSSPRRAISTPRRCSTP